MGSKPKQPKTPGLSNSQIREIESLFRDLGNEVQATARVQRSLLTQQRMEVRRAGNQQRAAQAQQQNLLQQYTALQNAQLQQQQQMANTEAALASQQQRRVNVATQNQRNAAMSDWLKSQGTASFNLQRAISYNTRRIQNV